MLKKKLKKNFYNKFNNISQKLPILIKHHDLLLKIKIFKYILHVYVF